MKSEIIEEVRVLSKGSVAFARYTGSSVADMQDLRRQAEGTVIRVIKNRLFKRALGRDIPLTGQLIYAFHKADEAAPARALRSLELQGGLLDGKLISAEEATILSQLPTRDQLVYEIVDSLIMIGDL